MSSQSNYCINHSSVETRLLCGKCDDAICLSCTVHAPVGIRCSKCAKVKRLPTYDITTLVLLRAICVGLAISVLVVLVSSFTLRSIFGWSVLLDLVVILVAGHIIGWGISVSVNRKRGRVLKMVAAGSVVIAAAIVSVTGVGSFSIFVFVPGLITLAVALYLATNHF